jgi:CubicO group peptidase (beta-lactamase class C family)
MRTLPLYIVLLIGLVTVGCGKKEGAAEQQQPRFNENGLPILHRLSPPFAALKPQQVQQKKADIAQYFKSVWSETNDNVSFLVAQNGQILFEKYVGYAHRNRKEAIEANTPLHIASVSKVLTATAILMLVDAEKLQLDQKITAFFPEFPYPEVTILTLLNHRSGLSNYAYFTYDKNVWDTHQNLTNADLIPLMVEKNISLEYPTDTHFSYCNTNYALLALVIEKITGLSYPEAMRQMIFEPLGMKHSFVFEIDRHKGKVAPSYKGNNMELAFDYLDGVYGDKNIFSTPRDLLIFDMARYDKEFLNPDLVKKMYSGYSYEHKGKKNYGLGIRMIEFEEGEPFYFHNGWWHGNTSSYINLRKEKVTIIALSNKYTKKTYTSKKLAGLFGNYPFHPKGEGEE